MKSVLVSVLIGITVTGRLALAGDPRVAELNKGLNTCQSEVQIENASKALKFFDYIKSWDTKSQHEALAENFVLWNSSRAFAFAVTPDEKKAGLIFGNGQVTKTQYAEYVAKTRYSYDFDQYYILPTRIDCIGDATVAVSTVFSGLAVKRDEKGYIRYAVEVKTPVRQIIELNSAGLIEKELVDLDDAVTLKLAKDFAELIGKGVPNVEIDEATRATLPELIDSENKKIKD